MAGLPETNVRAMSARQPGAGRNSGVAWDAGVLGRIRINRSAVERRAATLVARRAIKKNHQAAWLLKAVTCIDLTTLSGDDTPGRVRRLCQKARRPVRADILEALGAADLGITTGAVCVYHNLVGVAVEELAVLLQYDGEPQPARPESPGPEKAAP